MPAPRIFDHDEARALRAQGMSYQQIADMFGVSATGIARVCDPERGAKVAARSAQAIRDARAPCAGGCGTLVWTHGRRPRTGFCNACSAHIRAADGVRETELLCRTCDTWKPDDDFGKEQRATRRGRRSTCRACETAARRRRRRENPEMTHAYDNARKREGLPMTKFIVLHNSDNNGIWTVHSTVEAVSKMAAVEDAASAPGQYVAITAAQIMEVQEVTKLAIVRPPRGKG